MGWIFGGWPPPPPSAAGGVSFAAVKAALALADSPVGFNGQPLVSLGRSAARDSAALVESSLIADPLLQRWTQPPAVVLNAGDTLIVPSPAAGFLRVLSVTVTALSGAPTYNATLEPSGLFISARNQTTGGVTTAALNIPQAGGIVYDETETVQVVFGGAGTVGVIYRYIDITALNRTVVRAQFAVPPGNAAVVIIPAAPTGFYRRPVPILLQSSTSAAIVAANIICNDDTASVTPDWLLGAVGCDRQAPIATGAVASSIAGVRITVAGDALSVKAVAAATDVTRRPVVFCVYETLPVGVP